MFVADERTRHASLITNLLQVWFHESAMTGTLPSLLDKLKSGLAAIYGERLRGVYLYGSYARGEQDWESDVDVLVVLDEVPRYGAEVDRTGELIANLSLAYDVSVSRVVVSERTWRTGDTLFLANVRDEAVPA
jgi:predicted nucleotidyltransferase